VIGSFDHPLADKCVGWGEIKNPYLKSPYLGDYHLLIINLQSLYEVELNEEMQKALEEMRKEINEIIWANTEIICITAPTINKGGFIVDHNSEQFPSISNYHWCPIYFNFVKQEGENFEEKPIGGYFDFVKKWTHFLENWSMKMYTLRIREKGYPTGKREYVIPKFEALLKNLAKKLLAFKVYFLEFNADESSSGGLYNIRNEIYSNPITFLPPPTEISIKEAIDYLLRQERGIIEIKETELPKWTENITIYGEGLIKKKIKESEELKKKCEKELEENNLKLAKLFRFKRLLTTDGPELEVIIEESFKLLGIGIKLGPKGKEDRIIIDPDTNSELPIEITGVKNSIPERKLNQLIGRLVEEERIKKIKCNCRGILIGNHYKDTPLNSNLEGRKVPFESDVIKKAEISKITLLSTIELFKVVNAKLAGKDIENFVKAVFNTPGEVFFKEL